MTAIHAFDGRRHAALVDPSEIRVDDWMRDCGRLRQVESLGALPNGGSVLVRFADDAGGRFATLSIPRSIRAVTVWRELADAAGAGRV